MTKATKTYIYNSKTRAYIIDAFYNSCEEGLTTFDIQVNWENVQRCYVVRYLIKYLRPIRVQVIVHYNISIYCFIKLIKP